MYKFIGVAYSHPPLVKLKLWELVIVFNKTFWSATNLCLRYAPAKCGRYFEISGYCFLQFRYLFVTVANIVTPYTSPVNMVTSTMFPWDKKASRTQKSLIQQCINSLVSRKLSHDR